MNAILNKNSADIKDCSIYVALFPCNECSKLIIQAGIKEVIFYSDKYHHQPNCKASRRLLDLARVKYRYCLSLNNCPLKCVSPVAKNYLKISVTP